MFKSEAHDDVVNFRMQRLTQYLRELLQKGDVVIDNAFQSFLGMQTLIAKLDQGQNGKENGSKYFNGRFLDCM